MANVYTIDILSGGSSGSVTVPMGYVYVIREIAGTIAAPPNGPPSAVFFDALGVQIYAATALPGQFLPFQWSGRIAVPETETVAAVVDGPGGWTYSITGYRLTLP